MPGDGALVAQQAVQLAAALERLLEGHAVEALLERLGAEPGELDGDLLGAVQADAHLLAGGPLG